MFPHVLMGFKINRDSQWSVDFSKVLFYTVNGRMARFWARVSRVLTIMVAALAHYYLLMYLVADLSELTERLSA